MYHPYLRGKQYELIMLRENAQLIAERGIHPLIEPVRSDTAALRRALSALAESGATCTVIVNPAVGELIGQTEFVLNELFVDRPESWGRIDAGYLMGPESRIENLTSCVRDYPAVGLSVVHGGYMDGRGLAQAAASLDTLERHIFLDGSAGKLYIRHFRDAGVPRVLVRDGFKQQSKNAQYPPSDHFSDLHITYGDDGMDGFGDYLSVGATYTESGGPAYAVALHITYLDDESDMYSFHFVSDRNDSPTDPGGKFLEAAGKLVAEAARPGTPILRTAACTELISLSARDYYPGLGYAKKLSMQHHVELMSAFLSGGA